MNLFNVTIETERLLLKPISYDYAEDIFIEFTTEIARYMTPKPAESIEEAKEMIKEYLEGLRNGTILQLVTVNKNTNEFIGLIGLFCIDTLEPSVKIWIKKSSHNNGYGAEAMDGLIDWANKNIKFNYINYPVDKRNESSRKIPEKYNGKIMKEYEKKGIGGNELYFLEYWIYPRNNKNQ
ncbi:MAG: GNAT family N-acetyltransferase [Treponema sp.]|nr:GNAT family N-acetyltransferase [Treponema sp.]